MGRVRQALSYNNAVDKHTVLTITAGKVDTEQLKGEGGINTDRVSSYQIAVCHDRGSQLVHCYHS